jgi:N6-L-threonylcarbamoyladenine synthase
MHVLGIETSCDETSASVLHDGHVLSNVISSQLVHQKYGGVVPELASRAHQRLIGEVVGEALARAGVLKTDLNGVAATYGPGLAGALLVGLSFAKAYAYALDVPFVGVNHMEGHLYSNFLAAPAPGYPFLSLIVSGGHTMLVHVLAPFEQHLLGQTRDDAAGEAFDKVAKILGLGYPGGPLIDQRASSGDAKRYRFPRTFLEEGSLDFSFSGIKTAVLYHVRDHGLPANDRDQADLCASFQAAIIDVLVRKTVIAAGRCSVNQVSLAGGVSANSSLRARMVAEASSRGITVYYPSLEYCMDNGAMIAYVGWLKLLRGVRSPLSLGVVPNLDVG